MGDCLGQHGLACAWRTPEQYTPGRVNSDLAVQFVVSQRQLYCLPDLLLLDVVASDVLHRGEAHQYMQCMHAYAEQELVLRSFAALVWQQQQCMREDDERALCVNCSCR